MDIVQAFTSGKIDGSNLKLQSHIVTAISNVFVFEDKVYKIYKGDNDFFNKNFNDLSSKEVRFKFTREDFGWNHKLSPEIYLELRGVISKGEDVVFTEPDDSAEELVIEMSKVNTANSLLKCLIEKRVTLKDCHNIGFQLGKRVAHIQESPNLSLYEDFISRQKDLVAWTSGVKEVPAEEVKIYTDYVLNFIQEHKEELNGSKNLVGVCIDVHGDNAIFENGNFIPMDTYSPKKDWLYGYKYINIYRVACDIYAFMGKEAFDAVLAGYEESTGDKLNRAYDKFMIIYCELIMWPYQYMLTEKEGWRKEIAEKYHTLLKQVFSEK